MVDHSIDFEGRVAPARVDGVFFPWSHIGEKTPAIADGDCFLRCAVVDHTIDSQSRVATAIVDGVSFLWSHIGEKTPAIADGECS